VIAFNEQKKTDIRQIATRILLKVDSRKAYADVLLGHALTNATIVGRDRALLTELVYGTLRWRGKIDARLKPYLHRSLTDTDPVVRNLLRVTVYQVLFLDKVPDYAAVHEAVELAKTHGGRKVAGFVNGVLRNFLREKDKPADSQGTNDDWKTVLAIESSHPRWLVKKWLGYFGREETEALTKANNEAAPLVLRANERRVTRQSLLDLLMTAEILARPTRWSPQGIWVQGAASVTQLPGFHEGLFQVQGEASQLVSYLLCPRSGERILDACAAPGGKTTHIAQLMEDTGQLIALDRSERGIEQIRENILRLGLESICTARVDVTQELPTALRDPYDRILVDAPCSGLGTLRSHPEIKWHRDESDVKRLVCLQRIILNRVSSCLKPGGILVYSTCTLTKDENESVVEDFLEHHKKFVLEDAASYLPKKARSLIRGRYFMALPQRHNTDGFFAARMRKLS
jgi:16S rRNA (cytosine967-C5)-methyltransferase